jgi:hypothetical protein
MLPLTRRIEVLPGRAAAFRLQVKCAQTERIIGISSGLKPVCPAPPGLEVVGFATTPEHPFRIKTEAISSGGNRIQVISDRIYAITLRPRSNRAGALQGRSEGVSEAREALEDDLMSADQAMKVGSLVIERYSAETPDAFLRRIVGDYVFFEDELEQFQHLGDPTDPSSITTSDVVTDLCGHSEDAETIGLLEPTAPSNVIAFLRGFRGLYEPTRRTIERLSTDAGLSERDRVKAKWIVAQLNE